jgi:hypothetical protein
VGRVGIVDVSRRCNVSTRGRPYQLNTESTRSCALRRYSDTIFVIAERLSATECYGVAGDCDGVLRSASTAPGGLPVTRLTRSEIPDGWTSAPVLAAAATSACYTLKRALELSEHSRLPQGPQVRAQRRRHGSTRRPASKSWRSRPSSAPPPGSSPESNLPSPPL